MRFLVAGPRAEPSVFQMPVVTNSRRRKLPANSAAPSADFFDTTSPIRRGLGSQGRQSCPATHEHGEHAGTGFAEEGQGSGCAVVGSEIRLSCRRSGRTVRRDSCRESRPG